MSDPQSGRITRAAPLCRRLDPQSASSETERRLHGHVASRNRIRYTDLGYGEDSFVEESPRFLTIELPRDAAVCVKFRQDSYACSVSDGARFDRECDRGMATHISIGCGTRIAESGGISSRVEKQERNRRTRWRMRPRGDPPFGYVNLFYLVPGVRGSGLSRSLHE